MSYDSTLPGFHAMRVTQSPHEIQELQVQFPLLSRTEISDAIARTGPMRVEVERELARLSSIKR
jgi:hypothetical protein